MGSMTFAPCTPGEEWTAAACEGGSGGSGASAGSGSLVFISSATGSGDATVEMALPGGYIAYEVWYWTFPEDDDRHLYLRFSTDGGSTFDSSTAAYQKGNADHIGASSEFYQTNSATVITQSWNVGNLSSEGVQGRNRIWFPHEAVRTRVDGNAFNRQDNGNAAAFLPFGRYNSTADVDAIQYLWNSGNHGDYAFYLFGLEGAT